MKIKIVSAVLAVVMTAGIVTGCQSASSSASDKNYTELENADITAQLSSIDYDFEKEYIHGDFNAHSNNDTDRQGGIDTFEDTDVVYQDIDYEQFLYLLEQEGNYLIQLSGSWCHNSRAMSPSVNAYAKEYGIDTIYMYDFDLDNNEDGSTFIRMTNGVNTVGAKYNYMYGEVVSRYLTNLNDWVAYPEDADSAISYTNADGKEVTVAKLQEPFLFLYNKDNTIDNSDSGNGSKSCPVVYAFEEMMDRDSDGLYVKEYDDEGNVVNDEDGNPIRNYITDEYNDRLREIFDYIKDNDVKLSHYTKEDYAREAFNSYGTQIFKDDEAVNLYSVTYRELEWLLKEDGNALILFGGPWDEGTRAIAPALNDYAVANNVKVYLCDTLVDSNYTIEKWGYTQTTSICDSESPILSMYTNLLAKYFTNLEAGKTLKDETPLIQAPYLLAYNKDAVDEDGFIAPVAGYAEFNYRLDEEARYYIGKEKNYEACKESILGVFQSYAGNAGIEIAAIK